MSHEFNQACINGKITMVMELLKKGANVRFHSNSPFFNACQNGHLESVKTLLQSSEIEVHADAFEKDYEAFKAACLYNHLSVVEFLFEYYENHFQNNPLEKEKFNIQIIESIYWTCDMGHTEILRFLISKITDIPQEHISTAALRAITSDKLESFKFLISDEHPFQISLNQNFINSAYLKGAGKISKFLIIEHGMTPEISCIFGNDDLKKTTDIIIQKSLLEKTLSINCPESKQSGKNKI